MQMGEQLMGNKHWNASTISMIGLEKTFQPQLTRMILHMAGVLLQDGLQIQNTKWAPRHQRIP